MVTLGQAACRFKPEQNLRCNLIREKKKRQSDYANVPLSTKTQAGFTAHIAAGG